MSELVIKNVKMFVSQEICVGNCSNVYPTAISTPTTLQLPYSRTQCVTTMPMATQIRKKKTHNNAVKSDILALCPDEFPVTRYHSLVVDEASLSDELKVTARTAAGTIMGLSHVEVELHGVQFHPESIASVAGYRILASFLQICGHEIIPGDELDALEAQILRLDQRFPDQMHA